jgi:hypothetical protein
MGMDWHSSGITTSVMGALKRGLTPRSHELGIHVCGGRGKHSRQTPQELISIGERVGVDGNNLAKASRLVAKVDSAAVQDGFDPMRRASFRGPECNVVPPSAAFSTAGRVFPSTYRQLARIYG